MNFAELVTATNFSFLRGASPGEEMVARALAMGMTGIGIADRNTVAGVVRAHRVWKEMGRAKSGLRLLVGARLVFADGTPDVVAYPMTRHGWGRLTRLLTVGNRKAKKGECELHLSDLVEHAQDLALIVMPGDGDADEALLATLRGLTPKLWLAATMPRAGRDARRLTQRMALAARAGVPLIATNDVLYASPEDRPMQDVLTCIREGLTVQTAGRRLAANAERHLKFPAEMARLFRACPEALTATQDLMACVTFTLDDLKYEYPHEPVPEGWEPQPWLEHLVMEGSRKWFPDGLPPKYQETLDEEFGLIREQKIAYYFLTVHDIVQYARGLEKPILCQGRGSAANSLVCYFLGVTPIDPVQERLLFTRFLSTERDEPPDIDVDFEHSRREEVMQYIYRRYGRERAGIAATTICYRQRSAIREVGKVLGMSEDVTARLSGTVWGSWGGDELPETRLTEAGFDPGNPQVERLRDMVGRLLNYPRHLSQHVGGFVLSEGRLDELVPIHNAAMEDRTFIEWDKNDLESLGLMKVDILALGMLTAIRKSFDLLRDHGLRDLELATVPQGDKPTYDMLCTGDSIGTFQVESRAQIAMLPRMKPRILYDLVIQVAIVRPGPIQGGMVHPYLRRRTGEEEVVFPGPPGEMEDLLHKTMGVPLFQEQAMRLAIVAAKFTPAEADRLRRSMATFRRNGTIHQHQEKFVNGMVRRGYPQDFAEGCFKQIEGFGEYGFPESHAQAFGLLAYVSSWLKCHYPAVFTCALLNSQPMGFYAPAQLVADARQHGVEVRPIDIAASCWDNTLEGERILRLGLRQIGGFKENWAEALEKARKVAPIASLEDAARRANLPSRALRLLADADALGSLGQSRRQAGWEARRVPAVQLPLFAALDAPELAKEPDAALPAMAPSEEVVADYQTQRLSLKGHPMQFLRAHFEGQGALTCAGVNAAKDGRKVRVAGVVLIRQRPGKGNAIFITIEDETGVVNALLWAREFEKQRRAVMAARLMVIDGEVQHSKEGVVHLMVTCVTDASEALSRLSAPPALKPEPMPGDAVRHPVYDPNRPTSGHATRGHPRNVRILPRSRDFH
ncbi:error-prone DNA polymerase [Novosphingobium resinovorum]|uniref:error-prone DNA polymerase n=1 Tax=Novosphingobium TaxID=165696 RepID=UPI001B3C9AA1|nr:MULTISPECIES: error-prone DNA polymerase [Novosphingobium]MBF7010222.1 error-prone DNA polymerase [Novosphingobium sp. HR1a]WJM28233.1 error-prone DNA polymerase [Novosphingobium resinovorum]